MAYVVIPDGDIDQDSAATQPLFTALRDNLGEALSGAAGAPRVASAAMVAPVAGTTIVARLSDRVFTSQSTTYVSAFSGTVLVAGVVTVAVDIKADSGNTATVDFRKNGTSVSIQSHNTTSYVEKTVDITVAVGDRVSLFFKAGNVINSVYMNDVEIRSTTANMAVA